MSNIDLTLKLLREKGYVTKLVLQHYHIGNPADCIMRLRNRGFLIETEEHTDAAGRRYVRWVLLGGPVRGYAA